jgi:hypothetical protein
MNERKKLSDILRGSDRDALAKQWKDTQAAKELEPLPPGEYRFRILSGELFTSKNGKLAYKLSLEVVEGEHEGRRAWHDIYLTPAALEIAKRDLPKIGVTDLEQLERPLPAGILIRAKVARRKNDDGTEYNRVVRFEPAGIEPGDAFEPPPDGDAPKLAPKTDPRPGSGDSSALPSEPHSDGSTDGAGVETGELFPFGSNAPAGARVTPTPYEGGERR